MSEIALNLGDNLYLLLLAIGGWVMTYLENTKKKDEQKKTKEVEDFYDPDTGNMKVPESVPTRAWKMNDETKEWLCAGHNDSTKSSLLKQVEEAEAKGKTDYYITHPTGWYHINFGLIMGSAKGLKE